MKTIGRFFMINFMGGLSGAAARTGKVHNEKENKNI